MSDFYKLVGAKIRILRKEKGLTQEQLAEKANLSYTYLTRLERDGRNLSLATIEKIANALESSPSELLQFHDLNLFEARADKKLVLDNLYASLMKRSIEEIRIAQKISLEVLSAIDYGKNTKS
ncbi:helix-turn-helix domain-containing protein [Paenibacillus sp. FSL H8-0034]|uniref:helix-turn-helix domain-containing protein n=1 Tax=Paenibacillus sp. FSL H8-0034 TaxID=2954671 RepID=UPI0030F6993D